MIHFTVGMEVELLCGAPWVVSTQPLSLWASFPSLIVSLFFPLDRISLCSFPFLYSLLSLSLTFCLMKNSSVRKFARTIFALLSTNVKYNEYVKQCCYQPALSYHLYHTITFEPKEQEYSFLVLIGFLHHRFTRRTGVILFSSPRSCIH